MAIKLKAPYGVKDSALEQNRKHKINIEDWLGQLNAEFDKFYNLSEENKQEVLQELINYAREQATIDAKQDEEILKKALASELRAEEKARDEADKAITQELGDVKNTADSALRKANSLEHKGMYIGTYATLALADAQWPTKEQGDFVLIGASAPYQEYIWTNGAWEQAGIVNSVAIDTSIFANKDLANVLASIFKQKGIDAGLATQELVDSKTTSYATLQAGKYYLLKTNQDLTRSYWEFDPQAHVQADTTLHTTITTEQSSKIKYYKDQIIEFALQKDSTSKFENTTLFDRFIISDGVALVGGSSKTITSGEVISHTHTQVAHHHQLRVGDGTGDTFTRLAFSREGIRPAGGLATLANYDAGGAVEQQGYHDSSAGSQAGQYIQDTTPTINSTGGNFNKAYGLQILKCIYVAKKDITFAEMGE